MSMIELKNVTKRFGEKTVLSDLNFDVREGEIFGFIGPSGSGKTTCIRLMTGVLEPTEGEVRLMGVDPANPTTNIRERFGYLPQLFVLYPNLTVYENMNFAGALYGIGPIKRRRRIKELLNFVELTEASNRMAANVSGGMLRRLELAASLLHDPPLLFADEPTAGIDPVLRGKFWEEFRDLRAQGRTIFVTTQYVGEIEYCDRVGIIQDGKIVALDTPLGLRRTALGGEMVDIVLEELTMNSVNELRNLPFVSNVLFHQQNRNQLRVNVAEASEAIPQLVQCLNTAGSGIVTIEEYKPSFDEIFVELMKRGDQAREAKQAQEAASASAT
jgi:ABC-2 type transport system ATP-binding protein